jgi:hypothetical protein
LGAITPETVDISPAGGAAGRRGISGPAGRQRIGDCQKTGCSLLGEAV